MGGFMVDYLLDGENNNNSNKLCDFYLFQFANKFIWKIDEAVLELLVYMTSKDGNT